MRGAYRNFEPDEFAALILQHTGLRQSQKIGEDQGRPIYRLCR